MPAAPNGCRIYFARQQPKPQPGKPSPGGKPPPPEPPGAARRSPPCEVVNGGRFCAGGLPAHRGACKPHPAALAVQARPGKKQCRVHQDAAQEAPLRGERWLFAGQVRQDGLVILSTVEDTNDRHGFDIGLYHEGNDGIAPIIRDAQPRQQVVTLEAALRKRRQALAIGDDGIDVAGRSAWRAGVRDVGFDGVELRQRLRREPDGIAHAALLARLRRFAARCSRT